MLHALLGEQVHSALAKRGVRAAVEALVANSNAHSQFWGQDVMLVRPADPCQLGRDEG